MLLSIFNINALAENAYECEFYDMYYVNVFDKDNIYEFFAKNKNINKFCFIDSGKEYVFCPMLGYYDYERGCFDRENARLIYDNEYFLNFLKNNGITPKFYCTFSRKDAWFDGFVRYIYDGNEDYFVLLPSKHQKIGIADDRTPYTKNEIINMMTDKEFKLKVNGELVEYTGNNIQSYGMAYVPLKEIFEYVGIPVYYNSKEGYCEIGDKCYAEIGKTGGMIVKSLKSQEWIAINGKIINDELYISWKEFNQFHHIMDELNIDSQYNYADDICSIDIYLNKTGYYTLNVNYKNIETDKNSIYNAWIIRIPIRKTLEACGYDVQWDNDSRTITFGDFYLAVGDYSKLEYGKNIMFTFGHRNGAIIERNPLFGYFCDDTFYMYDYSFKQLLMLGAEVVWNKETEVLDIKMNQNNISSNTF